MSKFERIVHAGSLLVLMFAANRASHWLQTGELFPKPQPVLYESNLGEPEDWEFLGQPPRPHVDRNLQSLLEDFKKHDRPDFSTFDRPVGEPARAHPLLGKSFE